VLLLGFLFVLILLLLRQRLNYVRVCVEITTIEALVKEYELHYPNGAFITISADYEWIPSKSSS